MPMLRTSLMSSRLHQPTKIIQPMNCFLPSIIRGKNVPLVPSKRGEPIPEGKIPGLFSENLKTRLPYGSYVQALELGNLVPENDINFFKNSLLSYTLKGNVFEIEVTVYRHSDRLWILFI
jgi:hypothetical protein